MNLWNSTGYTKHSFASTLEFQMCLLLAMRTLHPTLIEVLR
jgi:hypothetical protein